jgi:hypothetical protein
MLVSVVAVGWVISVIKKTEMFQKHYQGASPDLA